MQTSKKLNEFSLAELPSTGNVKNILIVKQHNQFGDMLCTLPSFAAVRKKFPGAHITLVASPENYEILNGDKTYIDKILIFNKFSYLGILKFYFRLRKVRYDIGIVPSTVGLSKTSHIINYLSGAKKRVGVNSVDGKFNKSSKLLTVKKDYDWRGIKINHTEKYIDIIRQIGCDLNSEEQKNVYLKFSDDEINFGKKYYLENFPDKSRPVFAFQAGAGKIPNRWSSDNFAALIKKLNDEFNNYIFLTRGPMDDEVINMLKDKLSSNNINYNITSQPIRLCSVLLSMSDLYITNDTGTMHSAAYSGGRVLALFGPTPGYEWAPEKDNCTYMQSKSNDINDISVDEVYIRVKEIIENKSSRFPLLKRD
jgi:ADP-heptose:LPS heptosyltransferase